MLVHEHAKSVDIGVTSTYSAHKNLDSRRMGPARTTATM